MKKINKCYSCCDFVSHEHKFKITAIICGKVQRYLHKFLGLDKLWSRTSNSLEVANTALKRTEDLTSIGVDVHFKSHSKIWIVTKLKGGRIRHIDVEITDMRELNRLANELKERYAPKDLTFDLPWTMGQLHL